MTVGSNWISPLTGVVAVVLLVVGALVGGETPELEDTGDQVLSFYLEDDSSQIVASVLGAYGALFLIFFAGALRAALRRAEAAPGALPTVAFGGGVVAAVGILIFSGITFTLADASDSLDASAAQALNALNENLFFPLAVGMAALLLAAGIAIIRSTGLPSWLGWLAIVIAVATITPIGEWAVRVGLVWIVVTAIFLAVRPGPAHPERSAELR